MAEKKNKKGRLDNSKKKYEIYFEQYPKSIKKKTPGKGFRNIEKIGGKVGEEEQTETNNSISSEKNDTASSKES